MSTRLAERFIEDLEGLSDLPTHSPIIAQLLATLGRDDTSLSDVAGIIREDPVLTARVLRAANSAAYAARTPAVTIRDALLRLGLFTVRRLALVVSLYTAVPARGERGLQEAYWRHSLGVSHAAEAIARRATNWPAETDPEILFLGGLLHDIGLLALATHYKREYAAVLQAMKDDSLPFSDAERNVLQTDHGALGALLAAHWALPDPIVTIIRCHHRPETAPDEHQWNALVVSLADFVCGNEGIGESCEGESAAFDERACQMLGVRMDSVPQLIDEGQAAARRALSLLEVTAT